MVALPSQLFYNTQIPACLWFLARDKSNGKFRNRKGEFLFIDAREIGTMISRKQKELTMEDTIRIGEIYHNWRSKNWEQQYKDVPGLCKSVLLEEIRNNNHILTPGRFIEFKEDEDDGVEFEEKMNKLTSELKVQMNKAKELDDKITKNLTSVGYKI